MKTIETPGPPLTIEKRIRIFRNSSIAIAIVISLSFTASSLTFLHESKGYASVNGIRLCSRMVAAATGKVQPLLNRMLMMWQAYSNI
jgi:hypothetical protein